MNIKEAFKNLQTTLITPFFKRRKLFSFLRYYFRGRSYIYDIINFYQNNDLENILDVGANIGQSANEYRKYFKKTNIYCFEPVNETFNMLTKNTNMDKKIICENFALGDVKGNTVINLSNESGLNSLIDHVNSEFNTGNRQNINISTIDIYVNENKIKHINLIKIDTEGYDLNVLQGASQTLAENRVDFIVCEIGFLYEKNKGNFEDINQFLQSKGYFLAGIYDNYYWGTRNILHGFANAMFINRNLAFS